MALTYIHRTYKMSRPAREAVALSRMARAQRGDDGTRRVSGPSRCRGCRWRALRRESEDDEEAAEEAVQRR